MNRVLFDVSRWHLYLHRDARGLPPASFDDPLRLKLEDELFERLYSGAADPVAAVGDNLQRSVAERLHQACDASPGFGRLQAECRGDEVAAAAAGEALLEALGPLLSEDANPAPNALRRGLGRGVSAASEAVADVRGALEGLVGVTVPGCGSQPPSVGVGNEPRALARRLREDHRLKSIAMLTGRFKQVLSGKRRQRVREGCEEVASIGRGAELERLLPAELAGLLHPLRRLALLRRLTERDCLQYAIEGREPLGKGPLVVCLDKSESMEGRGDVFSTAAALALLDHARAERRAFGLICFNGEVTSEVLVRLGEQLPMQALTSGCAGGTDIAVAIGRALDLIQEQSKALRRADVVLVTDGESATESASELRARAAAMGVTVLGVGIGVPETALTPWCDDAALVRSLSSLDEDLAAALTR